MRLLKDPNEIPNKIPTLFYFFNKNIVFPAKVEYFYLFADFKLRILLYIFLDYSVRHFEFRIYLGYQLQ